MRPSGPLFNNVSCASTQFVVRKTFDTYHGNTPPNNCQHYHRVHHEAGVAPRPEKQGCLDRIRTLRAVRHMLTKETAW